jgi:hypothetical protein
MTPSRHRSTLSLILVLACVAGIPAQAAGKRRAVQHPGPAGPTGPQISVVVSGIVLDSVTGAPVNGARVRLGSRSSLTTTDGRFFSLSTTGPSPVSVEATRTGYKPKTEQLSTSGTHELTIRMDPLPTVRIRKTDNTTFDVDADSIEFGYPVLFSGYNKAEYEEFCKAGGAQVTIDRSQIRRIVGPAVARTDSPCCAGKDVLRVNLELTTGEKADFWFKDSCDAAVTTHIDVIARVHTTGLLEYIPFTDIAEVVFP